MYTKAEIKYTIECNKCKNQIIIENFTCTSGLTINLPVLTAESSTAFKDVLGYTLCWTCFENYRSDVTSLYYRLHKDVHGYDPRVS